MKSNDIVNYGASKLSIINKNFQGIRMLKHVIVVVVFILLAIVQSICSTSLVTTTIKQSQLLLEQQNVQLSSLRFKRQDAAHSAAAAAPSSSPSGSSSSSSSSSSASSSSDDPNSPGGGEPEEILTNFKCDFASSDQVDLCMFKVLPKQAGIGGKSGPTWSHGSGKLALYQGGPLVDSSRNDSTGGYIFYETSNPYVSQQGSNSNISFGNDALVRQDNPYYFIYNNRNNQQQQQQQQDHSGSNRLLIPQQQQHQSSSYQPVTSGSISVIGGMSSTSFVSPNLTAPGPSGMCLSFQYIIHGLSAEELIVHVNDHKSERSRQIWSSSESAQNNWTLGEVLYSVANTHSVSFSASNSIHASKDVQQRKFRGYIALDEITVAKHDPQVNQGACRGHCNFDGDLCGWTNAENGPDDDFDWSFGRGSDNLFTGPPRDFISSHNNGLTGSYLFTDSAYPRHPGDRAILISPPFQATTINEAMCMRFAVHMFGSGIGTLAIKIRYSELSSNGDNKNANDLVIWEMSGDAGNNWHQAQTSVSSSKQPFQVIIEGTIGENHLGNIAIDEISFSSGACPTSPPVASKNYGDCTFEQSMCYWKNSEPDAHLDDLDWVRSGDEQTIHGPNFDHTLKKRSGYYLKLENTYREPKSGTRAFLLSPVFQPRNNPVLGNTVQCLSFYYYMFLKSVSQSGPNLGTIRVYLATNSELIPIWRLTNPITSPNWKQARAVLSITSVDGQPVAPTKFFQIAFEGVWGDAASGAIAIDDITIFDGACEILPLEAKSVAGECSFDADMCSWSNKTLETTNNADLIDSSKSPFFQSVNSQQHINVVASNGGGIKQTKRFGWQLATVDLRPVNLQDHTYKAPIGYAFVDILDSSAATTILQSFILQGAEVSVGEGQQVSMCLSFWFAGFGRSDSNRLSVYLTQSSQQQSSSGGGGGDNSGTGTGTNVNNRNNNNNNNNNSPGSGTAKNQLTTNGGTSSSASSNTNQVSSGGSGSTFSQSGNQNGAINSNIDSANIANSQNSDETDPGAWRVAKGNLLWSVTLKNITEVNRRKWLYGQVSIKADSNFIIRYEASSSDGGFALDDINFYESTCETRPAQAKVSQSITDDQANDSRSP